MGAHSRHGNPCSRAPSKKRSRGAESDDDEDFVSQYYGQYDPDQDEDEDEDMDGDYDDPQYGDDEEPDPPTGFEEPPDPPGAEPLGTSREGPTRDRSRVLGSVAPL